MSHNKLNQELVIKQFIEVHGGKNDHLEIIIGNSRGKINVVCREHGVF